MAYELAKNKAWDDLAALAPKNKFQIKFLADEYAIDIEKKSVESLISLWGRRPAGAPGCNVPAKDFTAIVLLHYLARKIQGLAALSGEWLTFRELAVIEGYQSAFKKRVTEPIVRKYGTNPEGIFSVLSRMPSKKADFADVSIIIEALEGVPVLIKLLKADEEFGPEAHIFFDRSLSSIFCIEDIIVLAGLVAANI